VTVAKNIEAIILDRPIKPFRFKMLGQLASIGHHTGVAMVFGIKFSGFIAWWFWRSMYLMKLPRLAKKLRVMTSWTLDLFFGQEIEQMVTVRDIEALSGQLTRIRARAKEARSTSAASVLANSAHDKPE
jgi:NADH dehydrogenase